MRGNLVITEEQTNGGCLHAFIESLQAAGDKHKGGGPQAARAAAEFADARLCVARNIFQQMLIVVEFLHQHGLWGLALNPRSFFLSWTPAKCLIIKLRLPMLSQVTFTAAVAAVRRPARRTSMGAAPWDALHPAAAAALLLPRHLPRNRGTCVTTDLLR